LSVNANPFSAPGRFFKGNLHAHTTQSDGRLSPEDLVALYRDRGGYDFLAITDHDRFTDRPSLSSDGFLVVRGAEYHPGANALGFDHHIVCIGLTSEVPGARELGAQELIDAVAARGGVTILAHPYWHGCTFADLIGLEGAIGVEVFNTVCDLHIGKGPSGIVWDDLLARGKRLFGFAVDDCHASGPDFFGGWVMLKAQELSTDSVVAALKAGCFYSSCGPEIRDLVVTDDGLRIECSPVREVRILSRGPSGAAFYAPRDDRLELVEHDMTNLKGYFRAQVTDDEGRSAWTNPFYLDDEGKLIR